MAREQLKKVISSPGAVLSSGKSALLPAEAERVRELIASRHSKAALQMAKDLHKRCAGPESETLLIDAYKARIEDLLRLKMTVEAKSLMEILGDRFPAALAQLGEVKRELHALNGRLEEVVGPLADESLDAAERERIEAFVRQRVEDLPALAAVSSLPPEHPLRVAASALAAAFQAVTQGPVEDQLLALPQVSRRSPLAGWKALVRAIACYYRREDEACRQWLGTIAGDCAAARMVPAMNSMLGASAETNTGTKLSPAEDRLVAAAGDHGVALRSAVEALETAFQAKKRQPILEAIRAVAVASQRCNPALRDRLRQHFVARCMAHHIPLEAIRNISGGAPRKDAYFLRLVARGSEERHSAVGDEEAVRVWQQFRRAAIAEKWFAAGGLEDGVLALHMAQLVEKLPADLIEEIEDEESWNQAQGKRKREDSFPSVTMLYERACTADPSSEAFQKWLGWAQKDGDWKVADEVAERWRVAQPTEIQPLLHLMESAEKRSAFKKSLNYLQDAEKLDGLSPVVRKAKVRLLLAASFRQLRQGKAHLVAAEIERLQTVPEVRPGEIAALAAGLRWCCAVIDKDKAGQAAQAAELMESIGGVARHMLLVALMHEGKLGPKARLPEWKASPSDSAELLAGTIKACQLGEWAALDLPMLFGWSGEIAWFLTQPNCPADTAQLLTLGEAAMKDSAKELAYAASVAGLAGGQANARFLFLRGRALPDWAKPMRNGCLTAALELARRERDTELAGKIVDLIGVKSRSGYGLLLDTDPEIVRRPVSAELLQAILEEERKANKYPSQKSTPPPKYWSKLTPATSSEECDCPECRASRGEPMGGWDEEDDDEDEDTIFAGPSPQELTASVARILELMPPDLRQKAQEAINAGMDPLEACVQTIDNAQKAAKASKKASRVKRPDQGVLF
jgi:hypothetical protein